jgi:outer membrane protein assembly factor BamB
MSSNDEHVFLTHNMKANGNFTILEAVNGSAIYQYQDANQLLSPPGIFFKPTLGGNYADGTGNTNDLVVFGNRPYPNADSVAAGSASYAFQFPVAFTGAVSSLDVTTLLSDTDFQATTPPLITSSGKSMFWAVSRSKVVGWTGIAFDRDAGGNSIGFDRGDPPSLPIIAKLAMGMDTETPNLYSGTASSSFAGISTSANTLAELWQFTTSAPVYTQAKVLSGDKVDLVVYFIDQFGKAYAVSAKNGTEIWSSDASSDPVLGDFAMNAAGDTIYFADTVGVLKAWQIAEFGAPTTFSPVVSTVVPTTIAPVPPPSKKPIASSNQPTKTTNNTTISPVSTIAPVSSSPVTSVPVSSAPVSEETAAPTMSSAKMLVGHLASFSISAAVFLCFV